jgi:putative membrane protein
MRARWTARIMPRVCADASPACALHSKSMKALDPAVADAIREAVSGLERTSCAEVVVEIRGRAGSYAHAHARFASLLAFVALLVLLFSPWHFSPAWVAIDVAIVWTIGIFIARKSDVVRRTFTSKGERESMARLCAAAAFHERGIANTARESGVLVFLSVLERHLDVLADRGVLEAVPSLEWNRIVEEARDHAATPPALVRVLHELSPLLACHLPWVEGDVDELTNVPRFVSE